MMIQKAILILVTLALSCVSSAQAGFENGSLGKLLVEKRAEQMRHEKELETLAKHLRTVHEDAEKALKSRNISMRSFAVYGFLTGFWAMSLRSDLQKGVTGGWIGISRLLIGVNAFLATWDLYSAYGSHKRLKALSREARELEKLFDEYRAVIKADREEVERLMREMNIQVIEAETL